MSRYMNFRPRRSLLAAALAAALAAPPATAGTTGIDLAVTVGTDTGDGACATSTSLIVPVGTAVNYCYVVTNHSGQDLALQTAADNIQGRFMTLDPQPIAAGQSVRFNRVAIALDAQTTTTLWTSLASAPDYTLAQNDADRVFANGFDAPANGPPAYAFVDIAGSGTQVPVDPSGNAVAPVGIGFPFTFYGITSDRVGVGINGGLLFDVAGGYLDYSPVSLPDATLGPAILPWWDTFFESPGAVFAQTLGDAPNRRFVVEWQDQLHFPATPDGVTFEVVLHEGSNVVDFQYADTLFGDPQYDHGGWATAGLNSGAAFAVQLSRNAPALLDGEIARFSPLPTPTCTATATVSVDVGKPVIEVRPGSLQASASAGASTSVPLTIGDSGTLPLTWSIDEAGGRSTTARAASRPTPRAPLGITVPAFAFDQLPDLPPLVRFDVLHPAGVTPVFSGARRIAGADFIGNDFSTLYALDYWQQELLAVQTTDCACIDQFVHIGWSPAPADEDWLGVHDDAATGKLVALSYGGLERRTSHLSTIDPASGATSVIGPIAGIDDPQLGTQVQAIAVSAEGRIYGIDGVGSNLIAIDPVTARASIIGPLGFRVAGADMDFDDASGILYLLAGDADLQAESTYVVDTASGFAQPIALVGVDGRSNGLSAFAIATSGPCAAPADVPWLTLDSTGGTVAAGDAASVTVGFDAATLTSGTYAATLCIDSDDGSHPRVIVPVSFEVL
ncbi:MAG: hypothetical protein ACHP7M_03320 [Burkholderiales bacterium]